MTDFDRNKLGPSKEWRLSKVKWFGGYNGQRDKENCFGFIIGLAGNDVYVHKNELINVTSLNEDQTVLYTLSKDVDGKSCAKYVYAFKQNDREVALVSIKYLIEADELSSQGNLVVENYLADVHSGVYGESVAEYFKSLIDEYVQAMGIFNAIESGIPLKFVSSDVCCEQLRDVGVVGAMEKGFSVSDIPKTLIENYIRDVGIFAALDSGVTPSQISARLFFELIEPRDVIDAVNHGFQLSIFPRRVIDSCVTEIGITKAIQIGIPIRYISNAVINEQILLIGVPEAIKNCIPIEKIPTIAIEQYINDAGLVNAVKLGIPLERVPDGVLIAQLARVGAFEAMSCGIPVGIIPLDLIEDSVREYGFAKILAHMSPLSFSVDFIDEHIESFKDWMSGITSGSIKLNSYVKPVISRKPTEWDDVLDFIGGDYDVSIKNETDDIELAEVEDPIAVIVDYISFSAALYLSFNGAIDVDKVHSRRCSELESFVKSQCKGENTIAIKSFVWNACSNVFPTVNGFRNHPVVRDLFIKAKIKEKFFMKNFRPITSDFFESNMAKDPEVFVLAKTLPLLYAKLPIEYIAETIFNDIWLALQNKLFDINNPCLLSLFPSCETMACYYHHNKSDIKLSCESFYWKTETEQEVIDGYHEYYHDKPGYLGLGASYTNIISRAGYNPDIFLCRSKRCFNPQFYANNERHFLDYSFYDWLAHYGYIYSSGDKPLKNDFPVRLAGYLNRVREIFSRLHCRKCGVLMIANRNYAKTEVLVYDVKSSRFVKKQTHAAYRSTVFHCNNHGCIEYGNECYINHCLNYKCYNIIDSRDLTERCSEGRYICTCGACCAEHAKKYGNVNNGEDPHGKYKKIYQNEWFSPGRLK